MITRKSKQETKLGGFTMIRLEHVTKKFKTKGNEDPDRQYFDWNSSS